MPLGMKKWGPWRPFCFCWYSVWPVENVLREEHFYIVDRDFTIYCRFQSRTYIPSRLQAMHRCNSLACRHPHSIVWHSVTFIQWYGMPLFECSSAPRLFYCVHRLFTGYEPSTLSVQNLAPSASPKRHFTGAKQLAQRLGRGVFRLCCHRVLRQIHDEVLLLHFCATPGAGACSHRTCYSYAALYHAYALKLAPSATGYHHGGGTIQLDLRLRRGVLPLDWRRLPCPVYVGVCFDRKPRHEPGEAGDVNQRAARHAPDAWQVVSCLQSDDIRTQQASTLANTHGRWSVWPE